MASASAGLVRFGDEYSGLPGLPFVMKGQPPFAAVTDLSDDLVNALLLDMLAGLSSHSDVRTCFILIPLFSLHVFT